MLPACSNITTALAAFTLAVAACIPSPARAGIIDYIKQYQVGVDYTRSYDDVDATYVTTAEGGAAEGGAAEGGAADGCKVISEATDDKPAKQRCTAQLTGANSSGLGIFLQQAFKRQGLFYVSADFGFTARYLKGELDPDEVERQRAAGLPLTSVKYELGALVIAPYVTLGITPLKLPELLVSLGPTLQIAAGQVAINGEKRTSVMATASQSLIRGYYEVELVLLRFKRGAFSLYTSRDVSGDGQGTKFFSEAKDGMEDIRADFSRSVRGGFLGLGLKLVFP